MAATDQNAAPQNATSLMIFDVCISPSPLERAAAYRITGASKAADTSSSSEHAVDAGAGVDLGVSYRRARLHEPNVWRAWSSVVLSSHYWRERVESGSCPNCGNGWKPVLSASGLRFTKQHVCSSNGYDPDFELRSARPASSYCAALRIPRRSFAAESIFSNRGSSRIGPRSGSTSKCRRCIGLCSFSKKG